MRGRCGAAEGENGGAEPSLAYMAHTRPQRTVQGAAAVNVHKVHVNALIHHDAAHVVKVLWGVPSQLHAKALFAGVALEQSPLTGLPAQQVAGHGHFPHGHIHALPHQHAPEGQVAHRGQRRQHNLARQVQALALNGARARSVHASGRLAQHLRIVRAGRGSRCCRRCCCC